MCSMCCNEEVHPGNMDIICGRGKMYDELPGNQLFRKLIQRHATTYASAETTRSEKSIVIRTVKEQLDSHAIRFIKRNDKNEWAGLEQKEVKIKIGHALRDVEAVRRKQEASRRKKIAKKKKWAQKTKRNTNVGLLNGSNLKSPAHDAPSQEPTLIESRVSTGASLSNSRLEEPIYSVDGLHEPRLEQEPMLNVEPTVVVRSLNAEGDGMKNTISTIQRSELPPHIDWTSSDYTEFDGPTAETALSGSISFLDMSLLLSGCEVPIVSCSNSSVTSDDWLCDAMVQL